MGTQESLALKKLHQMLRICFSFYDLTPIYGEWILFLILGNQSKTLENVVVSP
jgi:hypothetical protein